jgi:hypothetical protein
MLLCLPPFRTNHWAKGAQSCADSVSNRGGAELFFCFHRRTVDRVGCELVGLSLCCLSMLVDEGPKGLQTPNSPSGKSIDNLQCKIGSGAGSSRTQAFCDSLWMLGRCSLNLLWPALQFGESNHSAQCHMLHLLRCEGADQCRPRKREAKASTGIVSIV